MGPEHLTRATPRPGSLTAALANANTREDQTKILSKMQAEREQLISQVKGKTRIEAAHSEVGRQAHDESVKPAEFCESRGPNDTTLFIIDNPYPPCHRSFPALTEITIPELTLEMRHVGKILYVHTIGSSGSEHGAVVLQVQQFTYFSGDHKTRGATEEVILEWLAPSSAHVLPQDVPFGIKEPYLKISIDKIAQISVAHPNDIFVFPTPSRYTPVMRHPSAVEYKHAGDEAFKRKEFTDAQLAYSQGLVTHTWVEPAIERDIRRNRALTSLKLHRYDAALNDGLSALIPFDAYDGDSRRRNSKALLCAGYAAYSLGQFERATSYFRRSSDSYSLAETAENLRRTEARIAEQITGRYDFDAMVKESSPKVPRVDAASFLKQVDVRETTGRGRGLFANGDIATGDIVLVEKSFCSIFANEPEAFDAIRYEPAKGDSYSAPRAAFHKSVALKLKNNPSLVPAVCSLHADIPNQGRTDGQLCDGLPILDYFFLERLTALNSIGCRVPVDPEERPYPFGRAYGGKAVDSSGLWAMASYMNHSCIPNAGPSFIGDMLVLHAIQDIKAGDEIMFSYFDDPDYQTRSTRIKTSWGFDCQCPLCLAETQTPGEDMGERVYLRDLITEQEMEMSVIDGAIEAAEDNVYEVKETYDTTLYADLPRQDLFKAYVQLYVLHKRQGDTGQAETALLEGLDAMNIKLAFNGDNVQLLCSRRAVNDVVVACMVALADCNKAKGKVVLSEKIRDIAKSFYKMLNGTLHGFDQITRKAESTWRRRTRH